ncbi:MAG: thioredoxin family protein [Candidatus Sumerlaeaceae bacterium]
MTHDGSKFLGLAARRIALALCLLWITLPSTGQPAGWQTNLPAAKARARSEGRPLLILFVLEGCPDCARMERSLADPRAQRALEPFVKVMLEFNEHRDLAVRYGIQYTPTLLVYLPTDNFASCHERQVGSLSAASIERLAHRILGECQPYSFSVQTEHLAQENTAQPELPKQARSRSWRVAERYFSALPRTSAFSPRPSLSDFYHEATQPPTPKSQRLNPSRPRR